MLTPTQVVKAPTSALQALEQTTTALVSAISTHPSVVDGLGGKVSLAIPGSSDKVELRLPPRTLTLPELQRLKRQFVTVHKKAITLGTTEKGAVDWSEGSIARKFAAYVEENVRPLSTRLSICVSACAKSALEGAVAYL